MSGPEATAQPAAHSTPAAAAPAAGFRVMNYNILRAAADGHARDGGSIAPWSKRRPKVASIIRTNQAGVVTIEEAGTLVSRYKRQVVDLVDELGGTYRLAYTEIPPRQAGSRHLGIYIVYRSDLFKAPKHGDHFSLGHAKYAAYQILVHRDTGRKILFVSTHLSNGAGSDADQVRGDETRVLVDKVQKCYAEMGVLDMAGFNLDELMKADEDYAEQIDREKQELAARTAEVDEAIALGAG